ncbi:hypothetical protein HK102_008437, partial [Quaeritorhiza haematococci]
NFFTDVFEGQIIASVAVIIGLLLLCLKEYIVMNTPVDAQGNPIDLPDPPAAGVERDEVQGDQMNNAGGAAPVGVAQAAAAPAPVPAPAVVQPPPPPQPAPQPDHEPVPEPQPPQPEEEEEDDVPLVAPGAPRPRVPSYWGPWEPLEGQPTRVDYRQRPNTTQQRRPAPAPAPVMVQPPRAPAPPPPPQHQPAPFISAAQQVELQPPQPEEGNEDDQPLVAPRAPRMTTPIGFRPWAYQPLPAQQTHVVAASSHVESTTTTQSREDHKEKGKVAEEEEDEGPLVAPGAPKSRQFETLEEWHAWKSQSLSVRPLPDQRETVETERRKWEKAKDVWESMSSEGWGDGPSNAGRREEERPSWSYWGDDGKGTRRDGTKGRIVADWDAPWGGDGNLERRNVPAWKRNWDVKPGSGSTTTIESASVKNEATSVTGVAKGSTTPKPEQENEVDEEFDTPLPRKRNADWLERPGWGGLETPGLAGMAQSGSAPSWSSLLSDAGASSSSSLDVGRAVPVVGAGGDGVDLRDAKAEPVASSAVTRKVDEERSNVVGPAAKEAATTAEVKQHPSVFSHPLGVPLRDPLPIAPSSTASVPAGEEVPEGSSSSSSVKQKQPSPFPVDETLPVPSPPVINGEEVVATNPVVETRVDGAAVQEAILVRPQPTIAVQQVLPLPPPPPVPLVPIPQPQAALVNPAGPPPPPQVPIPQQEQPRQRVQERVEWDGWDGLEQPAQQPIPVPQPQPPQPPQPAQQPQPLPPQQQQQQPLNLNINVNVALQNGALAAEINAQGDVNAFFELVGIQGPLENLAQNVIMVVLVVLVAVGVGVWIPYMTGRIVVWFAGDVVKPIVEWLVRIALGWLQGITDPVLDPLVEAVVVLGKVVGAGLK